MYVFLLAIVLCELAILVCHLAEIVIKTKLDLIILLHDQ